MSHQKAEGGRMSKYLNFVEVFGDTIVMNKKQKEPLGKINYYKPWRQYVFEPINPGTVFNNECLMDIVKQINILNDAHKGVPK